MRTRNRKSIASILVIGCIWLGPAFPCFAEDVAAPQTAEGELPATQGNGGPGVHRPKKEVEVVLVQIGDLERNLLEVLRNGMEREMHVRFSIAPGTLEPRTQAQAEEDASLAYIASDILQRTPGSSRAALLSEAGVTEVELATRQGRRKLVLNHLNKNPSPEFDRHAKVIEQAAAAPAVPQYESEWFFHYFESRYRNNQASGVWGHLGVTSIGLYLSETDKRQSFGIFTPGYGVLSLAGLYAAGLDRSRMEQNALRLAIRYAFGILGVSPCRTPDCPYTRVSSPAGTRREDPVMCSDCRERLERVLLTMK